ncbi:MAG: hypothetical protein OXR73_28605 [Myxococcales bacterium]|nr:hypothetical protein [Myxococcales bacterium]
MAIPAAAAAQSQAITPGVSFRFGIERSAGQGGGATALTPLMVDASVRMWTDEATRIAWGGSLIAELNSGGAIGIAPRIELRHGLGDLELRPGAALPFFVAPMTMLGPELSAGVRLPLSHGFGLLGGLAVTMFLVGNNVPEDATLLQLTGSLGIDLALE